MHARFQGKDGSTKDRRRKGFSLVEALVSIMILSLILVSSLAVVRTVYEQLNISRNDTLVTQVLQFEIEHLRLMKWEDIEALSSGPVSHHSAFADSAGHIDIERIIHDIQPGRLKEIVFLAEWTTPGGSVVRRQYRSHFSKGGLNDYHFRTFN